MAGYNGLLFDTSTELLHAFMVRCDVALEPLILAPSRGRQLTWKSER